MENKEQVISMNFNARLEMDKLNKIMKKRGLEDKGRVQKFIDSEVIKLCGPYTPFQTGTYWNNNWERYCNL